MIRITEIKLTLDEAEELLKNKISEKLSIDIENIISFKIIRKSIDARKSEIKFTYTLDAELKDEDAVLNSVNDRNISAAPVKSFKLPENNKKQLKNRPLVIGAGPAGLFAALYYIYLGYKPLVIERGDDIAGRKKDFEKFIKQAVFDAESNIHFGLGGAGTFSDGKLVSGKKDELCRKVLEEFVAAGAPEEILYYNKPHMGTDHLQKIVANIRSKIIDNGGEFRFKTKLVDLIISDGSVKGVVTDKETIECDTVLLAVGNCARDTFEMLHKKELKIIQKNFAVGVRIEHHQKLINRAQYKKYTGHPRLGAADYKLVYHSKESRSAYTFCMCPGGYVVPSSAECNTVSTNGMSRYNRKAANSNSAIVVPVGPSDFGSDHPLAGVEFQRKLEKAAFETGGSNYFAPVQRMKDFLACRPSTSLSNVIPSYKPGVNLADLNTCLPEEISGTIREAVKGFSNKIRGFMKDNAVLTGIETQTSSPVRIVRDEKYESNIKGIYPAGEGSGYAGGIMSSAVDGIKAALASVTVE
ncbi:NAD(P)/FAD-dependent oxidoreductase [Elusimicrobiota bacterium]